MSSTNRRSPAERRRMVARGVVAAVLALTPATFVATSAFAAPLVLEPAVQADTAGGSGSGHGSSGSHHGSGHGSSGSHHGSGHGSSGSSHGSHG
ncbi:hypothetical protein [Nocardia sp. NPDC003963]